jgi:hypothetical protein
MMDSNYRGKRPKRFFLFPLFIIAAALIMGAVVMLLWNAVLPPLLNINQINYWQAIGLLVLCKILFGSFGPRRHYGEPPFRRTYWKDKWANMSDEEKTKFKEEWKKRCERRKEEQ